MVRTRVKRQLQAACCYAYSRLTLNYYMYYETALGEDFPRDILGPFSRRFHGILGDFLEGSPSLEALDALREQVICEMERATAYADSLQAYEYVLNRLEGRFEPRLMGRTAAPEPEAAAREIMGYIQNADDPSLMNQRIQNVVGQLPVRLTKRKFFALVEEGLSIYRRGTIQNLEDMMNILRSEALFNQPMESGEGYEMLHAFLEQCRNTDYGRMDAALYRSMAKTLEQSGDFLANLTWNILLLMNLVNDLYLIFLTREQVLMSAEEEHRTKEILGAVKCLFDAGKEAIPEELTQSLAFLEGKQEAYFEQWMRLQSPEEAAEEDETAANLLAQVETLMSGSSFMELSIPKEREEPVTGELLARTEEEFFRSLKDAWEGQPKVLVRAMMAKILSRLPVFFHSNEELYSYIKNSLETCEDDAEREASVRLIRMVMDEEME